MQNGNFLQRIFIYSVERFHPAQFVLLSLILAGVLGVGTQAYLFGRVLIVPVLLATLALFLFLLRLRILDEFKDYEHDLKFYPHRPVSRGLISKRELKNILVPVIILEFIVALIAGKAGLLLFLISFGYSLLMFKEFYLKDWIKSRFTIYILLHELLIIPLFFYLSAINGFKINNFSELFFWLVVVCAGLFMFLLEVARKIRAKDVEIASKDTYTAQYGIGGASFLVISISLLAIISLAVLLNILNKNYLTAIFAISPFLIFLFWRVYEFNRKPTPNNSKSVFSTSIIFVVISCLISIIYFIK